jgi:hypothetical protein
MRVRSGRGDRVRRRDFVALLGIAGGGGALSARPERPSKLRRLGYLSVARMPNLIEALQIDPESNFLGRA